MPTCRVGINTLVCKNMNSKLQSCQVVQWSQQALIMACGAHLQCNLQNVESTNKFGFHLAVSFCQAGRNESLDSVVKIESSLWFQSHLSSTGTQAWRTGPSELIGYNHDWVEVYTNGTWSFTGEASIRRICARPTTSALQSPSSGAKLLDYPWSVSWRYYTMHTP